MPVPKVPLLNNEHYHIFNRGANKQQIFLCKEDYLRFYLMLDYFNSVEPVRNFSHARVNATKQKQKLIQFKAYNLLSNHYHFLVEQLVDNGVSELMKRIGTGYTSYFNERYDRSGVLFQGKFKRVHIETEGQYNYLFAYINENHVVHDMQQETEVMYTSSLHYQKVFKSRILPEAVNEYSVTDNQKLCKEIFCNRQLLKKEIFDEES